MNNQQAISDAAFIREVGWWIFLECTFRELEATAEARGMIVTREEYGHIINMLGQEYVYTRNLPRKE